MDDDLVFHFRRALALIGGLVALFGGGTALAALPRPLERDTGIFPHQSTGLNEGGRALPAVVRPYAMKVAGIPRQQVFNLAKKEFTFAFENKTSVPESDDAATEIFLPSYHFGNSHAK